MISFNSKFTLVLGLCAAVALANVGDQAATGNRNISPEVICNKGHCYAKLFRPTSEFQEILEGQEIPPGLHVQMDYQTHKKYAKLIDPQESSQEDPSSILVVDTETPGTVHHNIDSLAISEHEATDETEDPTQIEESSRQNLQMAFDSIPELNEVIHQGEHQLYENYLEIVRSSQDPEIVTGALEELMDLSSDMEFGLLLVNGETLKTMVQLLYTTPDIGGPEEDARRSIRIGAALILGTAVQNHEKAQEAAFNASLHKTLLDRLEEETDTQVLRRLIFAYASLVRGGNSHPSHVFMQDDDVARLAAIFKKSDDYFFQRKCIYLMSDFADPEMQYVLDDSNDDGNEDSGSSASQSNGSWEHPTVNVGPWCEALQHIDLRKGHDDEHPEWLIIENAVEMLHTTYPDSCVLKSNRPHDEL
ncbi:hypothetical protein BGW38_001572 [Lunasporangiospora selenospora]|uniref:Nucleotide exchange factor SIL1 n=1 Tax=Lunasporangiospora selenospora TaxID=979761 RepID=A0A9P6KIA3_9FUNG|nr:hypothetical protein BGW38_001572 [Lunasporangiospora selenospora]